MGWGGAHRAGGLVAGGEGRSVDGRVARAGAAGSGAGAWGEVCLCRAKPACCYTWRGWDIIADPRMRGCVRYIAVMQDRLLRGMRWSLRKKVSVREHGNTVGHGTDSVLLRSLAGVDLSPGRAWGTVGSPPCRMAPTPGAAGGKGVVAGGRRGRGSARKPPRRRCPAAMP